MKLNNFGPDIGRKDDFVVEGMNFSIISKLNISIRIVKLLSPSNTSFFKIFGSANFTFF